MKNYRVLITEVNSDHPGWRDCGAIELINGKLIAKPIKDATRTRQGFGAVVLQKHSVHYTGIPNPWQSKVASALAWLIALVAAANSFFGWQKAWQLYTQTQLTLQFALSEWELRTAEARVAATDEDGLRALQDALQKLTKSVSESVSSETARYLRASRYPMFNQQRSPNPSIEGTASGKPLSAAHLKR